MTRVRQQWQIGDVFVVELKDGKFAVGQIVGHVPEVLNSVTCAFFDLCVPSVSETCSLELTSEHVIAIHFMHSRSP